MLTSKKSGKSKYKTQKIFVLRQTLMSSISNLILNFSHTHFVNEIEKRGSMPK